jgi:hypothetical protein
LGCLEEILGLVVGEVASFGCYIALLIGFCDAEAGDPALQSCAVTRLPKDVCNTRIYIALLVAVYPEWARIILYQLPFTEIG